MVPAEDTERAVKVLLEIAEDHESVSFGERIEAAKVVLEAAAR